MKKYTKCKYYLFGGYVFQLSEFNYKQKYKSIIIYYFYTDSMPRTEHLANVNSNHIYALDAQVKYIHHTANMTTAIIEDQNVQSKIKIPNSLNNIRDEIIEGMKYHFGFCYIAPNGWIKARNPDNTIRQQQQNSQANVSPVPLSDIVSNSPDLDGKYLTTILYIIKVHESQTITKNGKDLSMVILNCYANGYLIDVTLWNSDLPIAQLENKWVVFSGFRLKKLADWKFVFVSSVYSKIAAFNGDPRSIPFSPYGQYYNLSCVYQQRTLTQIKNFPAQCQKFFSQTQAILKKVEVFNYEGCSTCKKKINDGNCCPCKFGNDVKVYYILKLTLMDSLNNQMQASVFDEQLQKRISEIQGTKTFKFNIKSVRKQLENGQKAETHIITKISL